MEQQLRTRLEQLKRSSPPASSGLEELRQTLLRISAHSGAREELGKTAQQAQGAVAGGAAAAPLSVGRPGSGAFSSAGECRLHPAHSRH